MKVKVSELTDTALNWMVAKCDGFQPVYKNGAITPFFKKGGVVVALDTLNYSTSWVLGGPIIQRMDISILCCDTDYQDFSDRWAAECGANNASCSTEHQSHDSIMQFYTDGLMYGPTPLIAAMRCYVENKLGKMVELPDQFTSEI